MGTLWIIAWRNIWRHPVRSSAVMGAIVIGLLAGNFIAALTNGLLDQSFRDTIENQVSHIQVHHPDFPANPEARHAIPGGRAVFEEITAREEVAAASARLVFDGMIATAGLNAGIRIKGVDPADEARTTGLDRRLEKGNFFGEPGRLPAAVVGRELAEKMNLDTGSRIVLTFQDARGELVSASFRVEGIFSLASTAFERGNVFVRDRDLDKLAGREGMITEIAVLLENGRENYREMTELIQSDYPGLEVRNWEQIAPALFLQYNMLGQGQLWILAIIMMGVAFGILNTILMSVFERTRELGMIMALGMRRTRVFTMVLLETVMLSMGGGIAGLALSFFLVRILGRTGIDITATGADNLRGLGFSPVVYPSLDASFYLVAAAMIFLFAVLAAVYPAFRAIRLVPAEAVRKE